MIGVKIEGGLGNQLFQFAFAYSTAKRHKTFFAIIFDPIYKYLLFTYFRFYPFQGKISRIKNSLFLRYFNKKTIKYDSWKNPQENLKHKSNNSLYEGFFQSELYFKNAKIELLKMFRIKNKYKQKFNLKYLDFFNINKTAIIHIRRKDYLIYGNDRLGGKGLELPMSYYENFLELYKEDTNLKYIFISDDIEFVKQYFGESENYFYEENEMIVDFQLLIHGDILCLANSSFSWWGAYLNRKENKVIYAPNYWLGFKIKEEYPKGIIPENWKQISF